MSAKELLDRFVALKTGDQIDCTKCVRKFWLSMRRRQMKGAGSCV